MARSVHISLVGESDLIRKLNGLGDRVYRNVVASASRKSFKAVLDHAQSLVPTETGLLKSSLGVKQKKYPQSGRIVTVIGPRKGYGANVVVNLSGQRISQFRDPVKYAHLVEFGASPHTITAGGTTYTHPGAPAQPFMRPAYDANESKTVSGMKAYLSIGVEREARKAGKK